MGQSTGFYLEFVRVDSRWKWKNKPNLEQTICVYSCEFVVNLKKQTQFSRFLAHKCRLGEKQSQSRARCPRHARARRPRHETKAIGPVDLGVLCVLCGQFEKTNPIYGNLLRPMCVHSLPTWKNGPNRGQDALGTRGRDARDTKRTQSVRPRRAVPSAAEGSISTRFEKTNPIRPRTTCCRLRPKPLQCAGNNWISMKGPIR